MLQIKDLAEVEKGKAESSKLKVESLDRTEQSEALRGGSG